MPRAKITFDTVREIGLKLPEVAASPAYGALALKARGKLMACVAIHKSAEPGSLMVRIDLDQRAGLLEEAPETYYLTDHYRPYPSVLVRLSKITPEQLRDPLGAAWKYTTAESEKKKRRPASQRKSRTRRPG
ncbi:MAG TPA: hypothetical protein VFW44_01060 [Bryobacteraceae bacterium]|nr:hypothetical protein [Bryobacteraceae bacterium]